MFENLSLEVANIVEEELIKIYMSNDDKYGYNIKFGGNNMKHSNETKEKIAKSHMGYQHSEETKRKIKENHADFSGEKHPSYGKKLSEETKNKISKSHCDVSGKNNPMFGKTHSDEIKNKISTLKSKKVFQYDDSGNFIDEYPSTVKAKEITGICNVTIAQCCRGIVKHAGGYVWRYEKI